MAQRDGIKVKKVSQEISDALQPVMARGPFKMGTIAKLSGFSPALLRAWERRHGLLEPERGQGGHRMYTDDDLLVLRYVKQLLDRGRSIGEVAIAGREALLGRARRAAEPGAGDSNGQPLPQEPLLGQAPADELVEDLVDAALQIDSARIERALDQAFARYSMEGAIDSVLIPAAVEIGEMWSCGEATVASEHILSHAFHFRVQKLMDIAAAPSSLPPHVVSTCFPDELHQLGALIQSYRLVRRGLRVAFLGESMPFADLLAAVERRRPRAVVLSVTLRENYDNSRAGLLDFLSKTRLTGRVFVGGAGVPAEDAEVAAAGANFLPESVPLEDGLRRIVAAASPS